MEINPNSIYHPLPRPSELTEREKEDAMGGYLMMFASLAAGLPLPVVNLIAAVVYYFINRNKSRFIHFHALQSLLTQIPVSMLNGVFVLTTINAFIIQERSMPSSNYLWFLGVVGIVNFIYFVFSIVAAIRARKGRMYYFVFFGKVCYHKIYSKDSTLTYAHEPDNDINLPPE